MPGLVEQHHHRKTTVSKQKPFKARFASKNELKDRAKGKVERQQRGLRKTPHQQVMSKFDRRNQAKQRRAATQHENAKAASVFAGKDGAPRIVAVVPLTEDIVLDTAISRLNSSLDIDDVISLEGPTKVHIDRFKQKIAYVPVRRELFSAMDSCRAADYVLFVLSASQEVDELGETMLRCIEGQGVSQVYAAVQALDAVEPPKKRTQVVASLKSFITHFFPTQEKVFSLDSRQESQNLLRSLCTTTPKGIRWREDRSWMLVEDVRWTSSKSSQKDALDVGQEVILTGVVRGRNLKADRLVRAGDWGEFQISKITSAPLEQRAPKRQKNDAMAIDEEPESQTLDEATAEQDSLEELAPDEAIMEDFKVENLSTAGSEKKGVLLDDERYYSDGKEDADEELMPKRLPRGTSKYQSAWYLGDESDADSDFDEEDDVLDDAPMDDIDAIADGALGEAGPSNYQDHTEAGGTEYPESEMLLDPAPEDEKADIAAYRARRKTTEAEEDRQFPDEIELHPNVLAHERLARYRGLRSLRTSTWNTDEDKGHEPEDWQRLLDISDYKAAKSRVQREALVGGVRPGTRVHIHLKGVPPTLQQTYDATRPLALFSLLRHEHKRTACNYSIALSSDHTEPVKSKDELLIQCGPRRMLVNPLFSQAGNTPNDVHKFERYLHPGRNAIASFTAPLTWGSVPVLFFKRSAPEAATEASKADVAATDTTTAGGSQEPSWTLVGTGTCLPASTSRVIAKRAVLTGQPYKINRRVVTVRYMFFNTEDVAWFKALRLWTNRGKQGSIKESLGTHGYFKAMFDAKIGMQDAVAMSLYKRMWPRPARVMNLGDEV